MRLTTARQSGSSSTTSTRSRVGKPGGGGPPPKPPPPPLAAAASSCGPAAAPSDTDGRAPGAGGCAGGAAVHSIAAGRERAGAVAAPQRQRGRGAKGRPRGGRRKKGTNSATSLLCVLSPCLCSLQLPSRSGTRETAATRSFPERRLGRVVSLRSRPPAAPRAPSALHCPAGGTELTRTRSWRSWAVPWCVLAVPARPCSRPRSWSRLRTLAGSLCPADTTVVQQQPWRGERAEIGHAAFWPVAVCLKRALTGHEARACASPLASGAR